MKKYLHKINITLLLLCMSIANAYASSSEFIKPSTRALSEQTWTIVPVDDGYEANLRVEVTDINLDEVYSIRVEVIDVVTGEISILETPPLITVSKNKGKR